MNPWVGGSGPAPPAPPVASRGVGRRTTHTFLYRRECAVKTFSYTESRARYAEVLDLVVDDSEEVVITRAGMCQS